jgi:hypothetical protein
MRSARPSIEPRLNKSHLAVGFLWELDILFVSYFLQLEIKREPITVCVLHKLLVFILVCRYFIVFSYDFLIFRQSNFIPQMQAFFWW